MKNDALKKFNRNRVWLALFSGSFAFSWLTAASVVQASDLQIYAVPESGKKTIVMMLDTSGSMNSYDGTANCVTTKAASYSQTINGEQISYTRRGTTNNCSSGKTRYDRMTRLKDGMMALLNSDNPDLTRTSVGLGIYGHNSNNGKILVPANPLGVLNSPQRVALKKAIAGLSYNSMTPTAHAYAEAASYLMGTTTVPNGFVDRDVYKIITSKGKTYYYQCRRWNAADFADNVKRCRGRDGTDSDNWTYLGTTVPVDLSAYTPKNNFYVENVFVSESNDYTGFSASADDTKNDDETLYVSPLPNVDDRQSCDGQGVYILSDGAANNSGTSEASSVMKAALTQEFSTDFNCNSGIPNTSDSASGCMGSFAKKLFNPETNPAGVSIKTAFVGFGSSMNSLSQQYVINACRLASRAYNDPITKTVPNDACSPGTTNAVPSPSSQTAFDGGYGNGGFFIADTDAEVTNSVLQFIRNLGAAPLEPLTTGAIAVPYDALNPKNLDTAGYLRAIEPNPASTSLTWRGNLKKYETILTGINAGAFQDRSNNLVYTATGDFEEATKDFWNKAKTVGSNSAHYNDGGNIEMGGVRWNMPIPILGQDEERAADGTITKYAYAASSEVRNVYTDASTYDAAATTNPLSALTGSSSGTTLLRVPTAPTGGYTGTPAQTAAHVLNEFNTATTIKDYPPLLKRKLLNYLGFNLELTTEALPTTLPISEEPYFSLGGIIHSYPVQLTYSGTLDANGELTTIRERSVLFGTMEGGLHIVDADSGKEQSVFVPVEILNDTVKSKALSPTATDLNSPSHGVDGAWVADPSYEMTSTTSGGSTTTQVSAKRMNVYGGMRMGGNSYYGLDALKPGAPKLLFRINNQTTGYTDMGQSWSKPVLANVRYGNTIKRVMIIGGGYDQCYENPNFKLGATVANTDYPDTTCNNKTTAKGNAVYIVDATNGDLIWSATYQNDTSNVLNGRNYLKHSIVSRISTLDRDADGLVDHLYFGDLGGQIFRIDLNNNATNAAGLGKRVTRLANLASAITDTGYTSTNTYLDENAPRFYEPVTVTIHDESGKTFIVVGAASGNRSTPLDVAPITGREGMLPRTALSAKPVNNVFGIIDADFSNSTLISGTPTLLTVNKTLADLIRNPQLLPNGVTKVVDRFISGGSYHKFGWYRSLSSLHDGTEKADNAFRREGGLKAYEEPVAITNNLIVSVYDPEGDGVSPNDPCNPRIVGETDFQKFCLPFGACVNSDGTPNSSKEGGTGFQLTSDNKNSNVIGSGIRGLSFVAKSDGSPSPQGSCGRLTLAGNTSGTGEWQCTSHFVPTRWYERYR